MSNQVAIGVEDQVLDAGDLGRRVRRVLEGHEDIEGCFRAGCDLAGAIELDCGDFGFAKAGPLVSPVGEVSIALQGDGLSTG